MLSFDEPRPPKKFSCPVQVIIQPLGPVLLILLVFSWRYGSPHPPSRQSQSQSLKLIGLFFFFFPHVTKKINVRRIDHGNDCSPPKTPQTEQTRRRGKHATDSGAQIERCVVAPSFSINLPMSLNTFVQSTEYCLVSCLACRAHVSSELTYLTICDHVQIGFSASVSLLQTTRLSCTPCSNLRGAVW